MNKNPLDEIFTNETDVDPVLLRDILRPFIKINAEQNIVIFTEKALSLSIPDKLLLFLLAKKAQKFKAIDYLMKPINRDKLTKAIQKL